MLKVLSLFSGIGAFEKALKNLNIPFELVNFCEIDKYAVKSYCAIHGVPESKNLGDIAKVDAFALPDFDLMTYGFPCQDISLAGKQKGLFNEDGSQTRSGLFFEALRLIEAKKPKIAIAENVKNLTSKKFAEQFKIVLDSLSAAGYNNYWKVLNSKDYGIPQNRERVFIVSIRKDIDHGLFEFPAPFELKKRLKDVLESEVDEKYYLSDAMLNYIKDKEDKPYNFRCQINDVNGILESPLRSQDDKPVIRVKEATKSGYAEAVEGDSINLEQPNSTTRRGRVGHGVAQTLTTSCNQAVVVSEPMIVDDTYRNRKPRVYDEYAPSLRSERSGLKVVEPQALHSSRTEYGKAIRKAYESGKVKESRHNMTELVPRTDGICNTLTTVQKDNYIVEPQIKQVGQIYPNSGNPQAGRIYDSDGISPSLDTCSGGNRMPKVIYELRIRKLTPKECFRLMGFHDGDFSKAEAVNSNTQLYKQAGNSIVVDVLEELFCMMFDEEGILYV